LSWRVGEGFGPIKKQNKRNGTYADFSSLRENRQNRAARKKLGKTAELGFRWSNKKREEEKN